LGAQQARPSDAPWYTRARRCGHSNFVENDPQVFNIDEWVDYWSSLKVDAVTLSAGGMMAFYPTKIPLHHKSKFLGDRDLFGDFAKALKKKGIRVIARIDPKSNYGDAVRAHPEWFQRTADGHFRLRDEQGEEGAPPRDEWIYWTCMFSDYFTEFIPRVMREVNSLYEIDAFLAPVGPAKAAATARSANASGSWTRVRTANVIWCASWKSSVFGTPLRRRRDRTISTW